LMVCAFRLTADPDSLVIWARTDATARMLLFRTGRVPAMMAVGNSGRKSTANAAPIGPLDIRHHRRSEKAVARDGAVPHGGGCRSGPGSRDGPEPRPRRRDSHWPESLKP
jgi:hypothetical protein